METPDGPEDPRADSGEESSLRDGPVGWTPEASTPAAEGDEVVDSGLGAEIVRGAGYQAAVQQAATARQQFLSRRLHVTPLLVAVNCAVFFSAWVSGIHAQTIEDYGQLRLAVWSGEYWRLFSALFVHGNFAHLALNLLALVMLARVVERVLGWWRFTVTYFVSGLGGALCFQVLSDAGLGVGASGAVYGLVGVLVWIRFGRAADGRLAVTPRLVLWTLFLLVSDFLFAFLLETMQRGSGGFNVASSAHFGGFAAGIFLGYFFLAGLLRPLEQASVRWRWAAASTLAVLLTGLAVYGCLFPVQDPVWFVWKGFRAHEEGRTGEAEELFERSRSLVDKGERDRYFLTILDLALRGDHVDLATRYWREHPARNPWLQLQTGFLLHDTVMARGEAQDEDLAASILDDVIRNGEASLGLAVRAGDGADAAEPEDLAGPPAAERLNALAWAMALRGTRLEEASALAKDAVRRVVEQRDLAEGGLSWLLGGPRLRSAHAAYLNTQGWIEFQLGEAAQGVQHLEEAAELSPDGPHFLYLALAYYELDDFSRAGEAARKAKETGLTQDYERKLLDELLESLGEG